jgi:N-acetylmuramoyl-L-alanine amidase
MNVHVQTISARLRARRGRPWHRALVIAALAAGALAVRPAVSGAQSVETRYERTLARERSVRSPRATLAAVRSVAKAYEAVVRRYPNSGYADNALWQGASLWQLAFDRSKDPHDRAEATRLLSWLVKEYPSSSLRARARAQLRTPAPVQVARAKPAPPAAPEPVSPSRSTGPSGPADRSAPPAAPPALAVEAAAVRKATAPDGAEVIGISRMSLPKGDRILLELSREVPYTITRLSAPDRIVVELADVSSGPSSGVVAGVPGTFVTDVRAQSGAANTAHVVMQLAGRARYSTFPLYNPFRLAIDVERDGPAPTAATAAAASVASAPRDLVARAVARSNPAAAAPPVPALASAPAPAHPGPPGPTPAPAATTGQGDYSLARQLGLRVARVVIDPGHGGRDPGAEAHGVRESEVVLDVALRLEKLLLRQPGIEVVLTRRTDDYIGLDERTAIANRENADLFLSIHANASPRAAARGIETYFLNFASNPEAEAVAARENAASAQTMNTLPSLVKAIALNNKLAESRELAGLVETSLFTRMSPRTKGLKQIGVKQAPFVVLIGAEMPSVLAEISFLTNKTDAALLKQATYRQRIAQGLCDAIVRYQGSLKKVTTVASRVEAR